MTYVANVLRVMIASPADTVEARNAVEAAIYSWNHANAQNKQIILQPWRWETSSVPQLGDHPQSLINAQGVDESDLVFALFGGRLGSPTPGAVSGTVEEIERALEQKKPVHLYFSTAPLPNDVDTEQLEGLRDFKQQIQAKGLLGEFSNVSQLEHEIWKAIEFDITTLDLGTPALDRPNSGVRFQVQPQQEREIRDYDKKGKPRYKTRRWIDVTNSGDTDAQDVTFESAGENPSMIVLSGSLPTIIHANQTRRVNVDHVMAGSDADILRVRWSSEGEPQQQDFHVG
ncbi:DUF4062 domain-containing protein [Brevibacterium limosum]|uniref:DUF4062 domain-containing protein n=1 Tax=Brevibacterium limosum TaxID=2697565 RepID=UPI00141E77DA|nr:DUF4062 domain-containing protein [Brevibacterium limosum]